MDDGKFRLSPGLRRGGKANLPSRALGFPGFLFGTLPSVLPQPSAVGSLMKWLASDFSSLEPELLGGGRGGRVGSGGEGGERSWGGSGGLQSHV